MEETSENHGESPANGGGDASSESVPAPAVSPATEEAQCETRRKIDVLLKAVGDTPIMKNKKWTIEKTRTVQGLMDFIKKYLKLDASEQMRQVILSAYLHYILKLYESGHVQQAPREDQGAFIYVNQSFAPSPDQEVGILYECFGSDGKLVLHYCKSQAWG